MSSTVPSKRERPTNSLPSGNGLYAWLMPIFASTVGSKFLVALTGLGLSGFVIVHMLGNLQIFRGADALNAYAKTLKDLGALLWVARISLLTMFVLHMGLALRLNLRSEGARPIGYAYAQTVQATFASRTMLYSGLLILVFVAFHLAHYTFGLIQDPVGLDSKGRHDVYGMVIAGFKNPIIAVLYIVAQLVLMLHLSHGVASAFQSLGLNTPRTQMTFTLLGWAVALAVGVGNIGIVIAVWAGLLPLAA